MLLFFYLSMKNDIRKINSLLINLYGLPKKHKSRTNPLDALIATILSQNTTDKNSFRAFNNLKFRFKNWDDAARAKLSTLEKEIKIGGLAKQKAKTIKTILTSLFKMNGNLSLEHLSKMSNEDVINELISFNGVGVKTASCVLLFAMNRNVCPVDTHVHRVLNRVGLVNTKSADKTFEIINKNLPNGIAYSLHTNLIKLGRDICKASKPICSACPLIKICSYSEKNVTENKKLNKNHFLMLDNV